MNKVRDDVIGRLFHEDCEMNFLGDERIPQKVAEIISYGERIPFDAPDCVILYKGQCLAIEHFEFDCYENGHKGSQNKREQARIDRKFQAVLPSTQGNMMHDEIKGGSSYKYYVDNVSSIFLDHYSKIPKYKANLIERGIVQGEDSDIKMAFLIEDVSPLGSGAYDAEHQYSIQLARSKEFLVMIRNSPNIDYIISCSCVSSSVGMQNIIWLINRQEIDEHLKNSLDYASMNFMDFTPQVASFKIEIPKNENA